MTIYALGPIACMLLAVIIPLVLAELLSAPKCRDDYDIVPFPIDHAHRTGIVDWIYLTDDIIGTVEIMDGVREYCFFDRVRCCEYRLSKSERRDVDRIVDFLIRRASDDRFGQLWQLDRSQRWTLEAKGVRV